VDDVAESGLSRSAGEVEDHRITAELLQNWVVWRDAGNWERFRTIWHPDGRMMATWTQGGRDEFIWSARSPPPSRSCKAATANPGLPSAAPCLGRLAAPAGLALGGDAVRNFDESNITEAVLEKVRQAKDSRVRQVSGSLVRHLHAIVREIEPTQAEWGQAIEFLTRTGQTCTDTRQEFILLSDTLGVSMLVDAINHRLPGNATETTVLGPFYVQAAPEHGLGDDISKGMVGEPLLVEGTVSHTDGSPIAGATVDTWHTDGDGFYDVQGPVDLQGLAGRARFRTDAAGRFWFRSIVPASYPIPDDGPVGDMLKLQGRHPYRPAHVHFMIGHFGCETLVTHLFLAGDQYLDSDVVFGVKDSLIHSLEEQSAGETARGNWVDRPTKALRFDFVLAREQSASLAEAPAVAG